MQGGPSPRVRSCRRPARTRTSSRTRTQRRERVVAQLAGPDHVPQHAEQLVAKPTHAGLEIGEERSAAAGEQLAKFGRQLAFDRCRRGRERGEVAAEIERDTTVVAAERLEPTPAQLAARAQLIEHAGVVAADPRREHGTLEIGERDRHALDLLDRADQIIERFTGLIDAVPARQETSIEARLDGLDRGAELRERGSLEPPQDLDVAPLELAPTGHEFTFEQAILPKQ
jgi:hypothetical protein